MTWGDPVGTDRAVRRWVPLGVAVALLAALTGTVAGSATASGHRAGHAATGLSFVANRGQLDPRVAFYLPERTGGVYFTSRGATLSLPTVPGAPGYATHLRFVGGRTVPPVGSARLPGTVSSFVGSRWQTGIDTFAYIGARDGKTGFTLENIPAGNYDRVRFHIGNIRRIPVEAIDIHPQQR